MNQVQLGVFKTSEAINEIAASLCKFQGAILNPKTESENPYYGAKYADLATIWKTIRAPLATNGLAVLQGVGVARAADNNGEECDIVTVQTTLLHITGQFFSFDFTLVARPQKFKDEKGGFYFCVTPQVIGSCITYGRRYGISAMLGIAQEDDDGNAASQSPAKKQAQAAISADEVLKTLDAMYADPKCTKEAVSAYLKPRHALLQKLSDDDAAKVKAAHAKLMERLDKPKAEPKPEPKADAKPEPENPAEDPQAWTKSLKYCNEILTSLSKAVDAADLGAIREHAIEPNRASILPAHMTIIEKTIAGVEDKIAGNK